jgi:hypothetical protein
LLLAEDIQDEKAGLAHAVGSLVPGRPSFEAPKPDTAMRSLLLEEIGEKLTQAI